MDLLFWGIFVKYLIAKLVCAYTLTDEHNLQSALLTGYNKDLRPGIDRTYPFSVNASFALFSIKEFDLNIGKFTITGVFQLTWYDERLSWSPASYNQTNATSISQSKLWLPNFINTNPFEDVIGLGSDLISIRVLSSGLCNWYAIQAFEVICGADVTKYPFDTQYCELKFFIWGYDPQEIDVNFISSTVILTLYQENGIWEITDSATHTYVNVYGYEEIIVGFQLKRRTAYYISSLILPMISIQLLLGFVFLLPVESGERLGFSTTILLSIVVYLTIIQEMLPEASEPNVSMLSYILVSYVVSGSFLVVLVIINLRIQNCPCSNVVPQCIARLVIFCRKRKHNADAVEPVDSKSIMDFDGDENDKVTWIEVGRCFDIICFLISLIQFTITGITYMALVNP
ncbi:neuronal acetylcholine receptor subunit beta-3-like [Ostrea edulis]|uniref:neuronal acetylcholine receptor subunit beta-3-like n=1 Tax=Ostrea edulis TaxID=37623 RepID=UPI0024AFA2B6|nr:neuronal acetylcholine receptor subunit beta-3-like [Ostrea edulis]